jgi:hypothetical protein
MISTSRSRDSRRHKCRLQLPAQHRRLVRRMSQSRKVGAMSLVQVAEETVCRPKTVWLVARRPPINDLPYFWRRLAKIVYDRFHWCPDHGIDYGGIFADEAEARHAASEYGGFVMELPFNACLAKGAGQFGKHDFPLSEFSAEYRNRRPKYVHVLRQELAMLGRKIEEVETCAAGKCKT